MDCRTMQKPITDISSNKEWEVEFKPGEKDLASRGNKRRVNRERERVEFKRDKKEIGLKATIRDK